MGIVDETVEKWQRAAVERDAALTRACLAADVVFVSPLTDAFRFRGPDEVVEVLEVSFDVFADIRWHTAVGDGDTRALFFHGTANGEPVEEAQLLRFDGDGLIRELTYFGRPLPALTAAMVGLGGPLLKRQGRPGLARLITAATAPLAALTKVGERRLVPLADPARRRQPR